MKSIKYLILIFIFSFNFIDNELILKKINEERYKFCEGNLAFKDFISISDLYSSKIAKHLPVKEKEFYIFQFSTDESSLISYIAIWSEKSYVYGEIRINNGLKIKQKSNSINYLQTLDEQDERYFLEKIEDFNTKNIYPKEIKSLPLDKCILSKVTILNENILVKTMVFYK
jgi:hypothetical protein